MGKLLKDLLREQGASKQQLESSVVELCENAIAEMSEEQIKAIGLARAMEMTKSLDMASGNLATYKGIENSLRKTVNDAYSLQQELSTYVHGIEPKKETQQAMYIYRAVLKTTQEVFGETLSDDVMRTAIEAGSYGMWRSIMGESKPADSGRKRY